MRVLVIEDDKRLADMIRKMLETERYTVDLIHDGAAGMELALRGMHELAVIDWMLPGRDGPSIIRAIRNNQVQMGILMLTARGQVEDRVKGLESGADDYLVKPFSMEELLARLHAITRRFNPDGADVMELRVGNLVIDLRMHTLRRGEKSIELSRTEWDLLEYLMLHPRQTFTRANIRLCAGLLPWVAFSDCVLRGADAFIENTSQSEEASDSRASVRGPECRGRHLVPGDLDESAGRGVSISGGRLSLAWLAVPVVLVLFQGWQSAPRVGRVTTSAGNDRTTAVVAYDVKRVFADIDADHSDFGICRLGGARLGVRLDACDPGHGRAPFDAPPCRQAPSPAGGAGARPDHPILMSPVKHRARGFLASTRTHREVVALMDRAEERAGPEDVGEQALMRGLGTAFPFFRLGLSWSSVGHRSEDRPHNGFQEFPCRGPALTSARLMSSLRPF